MNEKKSLISSAKIGRAGELRVASELFLRGHSPSLSLDNDDVDLILANGIRIQVKTAHLDALGRYLFNFRGWKRISGQRKQIRNELKNVDFIVCWGINENLFLIFPKAALDNRTTINIPGTKVRGRKSSRQIYQNYLKYKNQWNLLNPKRGGDP